MDQSQRLRVLVISELFPNPARPAKGIFVERQVYYQREEVDQIVIAPVRIFPPLRIFKQIFHPKRFIDEWKLWQQEIKGIPTAWEKNDTQIFYPRYTSPPKQVFHATWGFFGYFFMRKQLHALYEIYHFDLIHAHYASPCGLIALLARRWMKVPVVLSIHGADLTYTVKQNPVSQRIITWIFKNVDMILANSQRTRQQIIHYGADPNIVQLVHLGANPPPNVREEIKSEPRNVPVLLSVGYLEKRKGHYYVLHALSNLVKDGYQFKYQIVGDGVEQTTLVKLIRELDLAKYVSLEGYKSHDEVWEYFQGCDIFVLPSWDEAFGVAYIEALSVGKPVIGCEGEGGPEDLKSLGDCIELVKPRDIVSLEKALRTLLDNPANRKQMGQVGYKIVQDNFRWEITAEKTLRVYSEVTIKKIVDKKQRLPSPT